MPAKWLPIHKEIKKVLAKNSELMILGGAGSGKSHFILNVLFKRAFVLAGSRQICFRKRFEHIKNTLWNSAKEHCEMEWPDVWDKLDKNRSGGTWSINFDNGSQIIFAGADDKERVEKVLGLEVATVYINEASEFLEENDIELIASRLRQKVDGRHLLLLDQNPSTKKHWSYERYIKKDGQVKGRAFFKINPIDVKENLPKSYIERLEALPERLRKRFLLGEFTDDIEGALWNFDMIEKARELDFGDRMRTVVAVDPAVSQNEHSDETGIVVCSKREKGYSVDEECSVRSSPTDWARRVMRAYYEHDADAIVVEVNQGGDLVRSNLRAIDQKPKIIEVRATKGKYLRAEPVASLYEQNMVAHNDDLKDLETQMQEWVPNSGMKSPDKIDALVYALTELALGKKKSSFVDF